MRQEDVKKILLEIEDTQLDFSLIFSGKKSKKVNGLYKPETHEIILHNHNFACDNELIYTAIHEYTHHKQLEAEGSLQKRPHTTKFWSMFHRLLGIAEEKGFYKIEIEAGSELEEITRQIRDVLMVEDGKIMKELGNLLIKARDLCLANHVRYEDYIDRVLRLPRSTASTLEKIKVYDVPPSIGADAMKAVANIKNPEKRRMAEDLYTTSPSPAVAKKALTVKKEEDEKVVLQKEKRRIERAIETMQERLKSVEARLCEIE